jgi:hypothetical protein
MHLAIDIGNTESVIGLFAPGSLEVVAHNRYSTLEANYIYSANENLNLADVLSRDPTLRRAALKRVLNRLPGRPFLVFTYLYVVRLGFLEGRSGLYYCLLRSYYELMISAKLWDLRKGRSQPN